MKKLEELLADVHLPRFFPVAYCHEQSELRDVPEALRQSFLQSGVLNAIRPGDTVSITAGSREIDRITEILRETVRMVRQAGGRPFLVPAMGSHGSATAQGQQAILEGFGITEATVGAPVRSCMDTAEIGRTEDGVPVHIDKHAAGADWIIPVGRIKPHTNFRGQVESGLMKMLVIGLGKQYGASICHQGGFPRMAENIWNFGHVILKHAPVLCGVGIVETRSHRINTLEVIPAHEIPRREPILLEYARTLLGELPFDGIDVLVVEEMGKEFCGLGMDPSIIGRSGTMPPGRPFAKCLAVLDLTEKSHGNAAGIGLADLISRRLFDKIDLEAIYINGITVGDVSGLRIPIVLDNDRLLLRFAIQSTARGTAPEKLRMVWIKNTADTDLFWVSEGLASDALNSDVLRICGSAGEPVFDKDGNLSSMPAVMNN